MRKFRNMTIIPGSQENIGCGYYGDAEKTILSLVKAILHTPAEVSDTKGELYIIVCFKDKLENVVYFYHHLSDLWDQKVYSIAEDMHYKVAKHYSTLESQPTEYDFKVHFLLNTHPLECCEDPQIAKLFSTF